jgi:hypothetical protein
MVGKDHLLFQMIRQECRGAVSGAVSRHRDGGGARFSLTAGRDLYLLDVWSSAKIISLPRVNVAHMEIATCATEIC